MNNAFEFRYQFRLFPEYVSERTLFVANMLINRLNAPLALCFDCHDHGNSATIDNCPVSVKQSRAGHECNFGARLGSHGM